MGKALPLLLALSAATVFAEASVNSRAHAQEVDTDSVATAARAFIATQGNGTPSQVGLGVFVPFAKNDNSLFYFDAQATADYPSGSGAYKSEIGSWSTSFGLDKDAIPFLDLDANSVSEQIEDIIDLVNDETPLNLEKRKFEVDEGYSFSPRLGAKILSENKKWLFDVNAGYDLRFVKASTDWGTLDGVTDTICGLANLFVGGCDYDSEEKGEKLFEQASFELSATNGKFTFLGYGNIALTDADSLTDSELVLGGDEPVVFLTSSVGLAPASTYGLDVDYAFNSKFGVSAGGYYISADRKYTTGSKGLPNAYFYDKSVDSVGAKLGFEYSPTPALNIAVNATHDDIYETRVSASVGYKFGASNAWRAPLSPAESIQQALSNVPSNRDIRLVNASALRAGADFGGEIDAIGGLIGSLIFEGPGFFGGPGMFIEDDGPDMIMEEDRGFALVAN